MTESLFDRRRRAGFSLLEGGDFLSVAKEHRITPRTLLAWRRHEYGKWENDPHEGREPGPPDDYDGEWPSEREELEEYARMKLDPTRLDDDGLRERYSAFLEEWNVMLESYKAPSSSAPIRGVRSRSRDRDPDQRRWLSLGYGGKTAPASTWRYWKKPKQDRQWVIAAPNGLAEFEQHGTTVYYNGAVIVTAKTQWQATWGALAYFYGELLQRLPPPELTD